MMKKIILNLIKLYQKIPSKVHGYCRHVPTCSSYAYEAIERYGIIKGGVLSVLRILKCNPFGSYGYDPVPNIEKGRKK